MEVTAALSEEWKSVVIFDGCSFISVSDDSCFYHRIMLFLLHLHDVFELTF
jgi:hypothetical protein